MATVSTMETTSTTSSINYGIDTVVWPPPSISDNPQDIIDQCEVIEMSDTDSAENPILPIIEMAALLYIGDYVHASHLWSRYRPSLVVIKDNSSNTTSTTTMPTTTSTSSSTSAMTRQTIGSTLEDWWKIGKSMMEYDISNAMKLLYQLQHNPNSVQPFSTYAKEIGEEYQFRMMEQLVLASNGNNKNNIANTSSSSCEMKLQIAKYFNIHSLEELQQTYYSQLTNRQQQQSQQAITAGTESKTMSKEKMVSFFETPLWTM